MEEVVARTESSVIKAVECFCGAGLSSLGLVRAGCDLVGACDIDHSAITIFNAQSILPPVAKCCDLDSYEIPACELLSGGPVCKAFSPGANRFGTQGKDDDRNTFPHFFRALDRCQPRFVMIENSFGLGRFDEDPESDQWPEPSMLNGYIGEIVKNLEGRGYKVDWTEVDCYNYGIPQHRKRLIFLGSRDVPWKVPSADFMWDRQGPCTVEDCLQDPPVHDPWPLTRPCTAREFDYMTRDPMRMRRHPVLEPNKAAGTVVSVYKKGVPYGVLRKPDGSLHMCGPRLAARLQGLPDEFRLDSVSRSKALECVGNGFPSQVVEAVMKGLIRVLSQNIVGAK